jgi:hypothetical protein
MPGQHVHASWGGSEKNPIAAFAAFGLFLFSPNEQAHVPKKKNPSAHCAWDFICGERGVIS